MWELPSEKGGAADGSRHQGAHWGSVGCRGTRARGEQHPEAELQQPGPPVPLALQSEQALTARGPQEPGIGPGTHGRSSALPTLLRSSCPSPSEHVWLNDSQARYLVCAVMTLQENKKKIKLPYLAM